TATPRWSSPRRTGSASTPSTPKHTRCGNRSTGSPKTLMPSTVFGTSASSRSVRVRAAAASAVRRSGCPGGAAAAPPAAARRAGGGRARQLGEGGGEADGDGHILDPGPAVPLLGSAKQEGREAQAPADQQGADPPGPAELVGGHRAEVGAEGGEVDGDVPGGG